MCFCAGLEPVYPQIDSIFFPYSTTLVASITANSSHLWEIGGGRGPEYFYAFLPILGDDSEYSCFHSVTPGPQDRLPLVPAANR